MRSHLVLMIGLTVSQVAPLRAAGEAPIVRCMQEKETNVSIAPQVKRMLRLQQEAHGATLALAEAKVNQAQLTPRLVDLTRRQQAAIAEARKIIAILEAEGSSVAFPEIFADLVERMRQVSARLARRELGADTLKLQRDIIQELKEILDQQES